MKESEQKGVCARTEHKEERVRLKNHRNGLVGLTFGCTIEGNTIQVELPDGTLDSWPADDCEEVRE